MADAHLNFAVSTVATAPSPATTGMSLVVAAGTGALFPTVPFNATVWPTSAQPTTTNAEVIRVIARSTDTLTIRRAQESSSARTIIVGDQIAATVTAKTLTDLEAGFSPNLALTAMVGSTDIDDVIPAATSAYVGSDYEIGGATYGPTPPLGTAISINLGNVNASPVTLTTPSTIPVIYVTALANPGFGGTGGNIRAGVYADSSGAPGPLLCQAPAVAFASTDTRIRLLPAAVEVSGTVWLAIQASANIAALDITAAAPGFAEQTGVYASGLPDPFGTPSLSAGSSTRGIYAALEFATEIGAGGTLEIG